MESDFYIINDYTANQSKIPSSSTFYNNRVVLSPPIPFLWAHNSHSGNYEFIVLIFFNLLGCVLVVRIRKKLFGHLPGMFKCHIIGSYHMKKLFRRTKSSTVFSSV